LEPFRPGEFDPQPFHVDPAAAKRTFFGGLVASGWHTAALTMRLLVEGGVPIAGGMVGAGGEIRWPNPTRPGGTLRVHSEVVEIVPSRIPPGSRHRHHSHRDAQSTR
jgi:acyl dehydratase